MSNKIKYIVTTVTFTVFIAFFVVLCILRAFHPVEYSNVEKRPLAQFPENITVESVLNTKDEDKSTIKQFEKYTVDQFPFREFFRTCKAHFVLDVLHLKENNGYTVKNDSIIEIKQNFNEKNIKYSLSRLKYIYEKYLMENGGNKYISIVPDKNYFLGRDYGYPVRDYAWLKQQAQETLPDMEYIDIMDTLSLDDYYLTDWHWSQPNLGETVDVLSEALGSADRISKDYQQNTMEGFLGGYAAQSALYPNPEELVYLTNDVLDNLIVFDYETNKEYGIYDFEQFKGKEPYNFFLSGTRALLRIDNPNATTDDELIIFRDSFGSSITPLLAQGYKSVYVVDIRYVMPDMLGQLLDFQDKDVLFLYSATILEQIAFK